VTPSRQEYVPGVCNIGRAEVRRRWVIGWSGLALTIVLWAIFIVLGVAQVWRLVLFVPATIAATGFLQATWHFCAKFGLGGVFNFGPEVGQTDTVEQAEFRRQDRRKALLIIGLSLLAGAAIAGAAYLSPR
jgi:hypothetical protein